MTRPIPFALTLLFTALCATSQAFAKLPPVSEETKAKADEAAAKSAWGDKVGAYKTCLAMDRVALNYRKNAQAAGKVVPEPAPGTPACSDPGPYVSAADSAAKPLEASGAHSPPDNAKAPPSSNATSAEISGGVKKPLN